jgi:hypothetical protein
VDSADDGRWLSYAELAELRGISRKAAMRLTLRHRWRRQPANDGTVRVCVPPDVAHRQTLRRDPRDDPPHDAALADANRRASDAIALADRLAAQLADAGMRADRAEERAAQERIAADRFRAEAEAARAAAVEAQEAAEGLRRAEAARKAKGRLRAALAALRGRF